MLYTAIILGLLGSFHCMGMCGPIAFMLPVDRSNKAKQTLQILSYHLGRLTTYTFIGFIFGLLGRGFELFGFQQYISILTGVLMILSIFLPKLFQGFKLSKSISKVIIKVKSTLGKELKEKRNDTFFTIGFLNGFLPCGLLYVALFGAIASHSLFLGSLYMFLFGLGTIPLMTTVVYFGNFANQVLRKNVQKIIPVAVVIIGVVFILRGLDLGLPYLSPSSLVSSLIGTGQVCH